MSGRGAFANRRYTRIVKEREEGKKDGKNEVNTKKKRTRGTRWDGAWGCSRHPTWCEESVSNVEPGRRRKKKK